MVGRGKPYKKYYYCSFEVLWIRKDRAVSTEKDKRPRCPFCNHLLRTKPHH